MRDARLVRFLSTIKAITPTRPNLLSQSPPLEYFKRFLGYLPIGVGGIIASLRTLAVNNRDAYYVAQRSSSTGQIYLIANLVVSAAIIAIYTLDFVANNL